MEKWKDQRCWVSFIYEILFSSNVMTHHLWVWVSILFLIDHEASIMEHGNQLCTDWPMRLIWRTCAKNCSKNECRWVNQNWRHDHWCISPNSCSDGVCRSPALIVQLFFVHNAHAICMRKNDQFKCKLTFSSGNYILLYCSTFCSNLEHVNFN